MLDPPALLLDVDGVLHIGDEALPGAVGALAELRGSSSGLRLLTNTTSKPRRQLHEQLRTLGFDVAPEELLTPAAIAVRHCRDHGHARVVLLVADALREDLAELEEAAPGETPDAIILGDLGAAFDDALLNRAFRMLMDGAELIALQHNRFYRRAGGLTLDVGAYAAALEYATGRAALVVGKPSPKFFGAALADLGADASNAVMVGDDVEADVDGALAAGLDAVLVRTGKYRADLVEASGVVPTATLDSIADLPAWLAGR